jgi:hypothetical protein
LGHTSYFSLLRIVPRWNTQKMRAFWLHSPTLV